MTVRIPLTRLVAAVSLTAAAGLTGVAVAAAPATAAGCTSSAGVTLVVDRNGLGGGVQETCDPSGGGRTAADLFGSRLTYAQREPGFVCRVDGAPTSDPCVNASPPDAYWSLWWSDGSSGSWTYSSVGARSLRIPEGGYVGFSWTSGGGREAPSSDPAAHAAESPPPPEPSGSGGSGSGGSSGGGSTGSGGSGSGGPTGSGGGSATGGTGGPGGSATGAPSPGDGPTGSASADPSDSPTGAEDERDGASAVRAGQALRRAARADREDRRERRGAGETGSADPSASADPTDEADLTVEESEQLTPTASPPEAGDGLPVWVAPGVVVLLLGGALGTFVARRRATDDA